MGVGDAVAVLVVGVVVAQLVWVIMLVSRVTAPFLASARPRRSAPVFIVMLVSAITVPTKLVPVPRVAELPTCQYTLQAVGTSDERDRAVAGGDQGRSRPGR